MLPPKDQVYSSIEGLIQHFELIMTNRGFAAPRRSVWLHRIRQRRTGLLHCQRRRKCSLARPHPAEQLHQLSGLPQADRRPHDQRRGGGAGKHQRHRGGVGSIKSGEILPWRYWIASLSTRNSAAGSRAFEECGIRVLDVLELLADGLSAEEVVAQLPDLELEDVRAALLFMP